MFHSSSKRLPATQSFALEAERFSPPLTFAARPLAVLSCPPLTLEKSPLAKLKTPPLMLAASQLALLAAPPLTLE